MRTKIEVELSRDALVTLLADYLRSGLPSALQAVIADAYVEASRSASSKGSCGDSAYLATCGNQTREHARVLRDVEDRIYLQNVNVATPSLVEELLAEIEASK